jgi:hypothetical protein
MRCMTWVGSTVGICEGAEPSDGPEHPLDCRCSRQDNSSKKPERCSMRRSRRKKVTSTPSQTHLQCTLDLMIQRAMGDPGIVRRMYLGLVKSFPGYHGEEGAKLAEMILKDLAREKGLDPSEWKPRVKEPRLKVMKRIGQLGSRELNLVKRTKTFEEYQRIMRHIEFEILEYVFARDEKYVSKRLKEALYELKIAGRWETLPANLKRSCQVAPHGEMLQEVDETKN